MALIISEVGREYPDKIIVKNFNVPYIKEHHAARRKIDRWEQAARAKNVVAVWHVKYKK